MRKSVIAATMAAIVLPAFAAPAFAAPPPWAPAHGRRAHDARIYDDHGRYREPHRIRRDQAYRGRDGRYYCKRDNGTTGLVVGGALGALVGNQLDGGRDRTVGTVLGAAGGALLGREVDRGDLKCQ